MNPSFHYESVAAIQPVSVRLRGHSLNIARCSLGVGVFDLKTLFPLAGTLGHEWVPERTPEGAKRSGACDPFPRNDSLSQGFGTWTNTALVFDNLVSVQVKFLSP